MIRGISKQADQFKTIILISPLFLYLLLSCESSNPYQGEEAHQVTDTPVTPQCVSSINNLTDFIEGRQINSYQWSVDGKYFYIQSGNDWWEYSIDEQEIAHLTNLMVVATRIPSLVELQYRSNLGNAYDLLKYSSSLSPSGTKLIYWDTPDRSKLLTPTPNSEQPPDENFSEDFELLSDITTDIYLLKEGNANPIYMGNVSGEVKMIHWFPGEEKVLLDMVMFSPYQLWLLEIPTQSLIPFLSLAETQTPKLRVLDISPDGNWVMYQPVTFPGYVEIKNVNDFSTRRLKMPRSGGAWWLPDGERIIAILPVNEANISEESVFLYDLKTDNLNQLTPETLNFTTNTSFRVFPNHIMLATKDRSDDWFMLKLCVVN